MLTKTEILGLRDMPFAQPSQAPWGGMTTRAVAHRGVRFRWSAGASPAIDAAMGSNVSADGFLIDGPNGQKTGNKTVPSGIKQRRISETKAGIVTSVRNGAIRGMPTDQMTIYGVPGQVQVIDTVHFGRQVPVPGGKPHCDNIAIPGVLGDILIQNCLIDHCLAGFPTIGINNVARLVMDPSHPVIGVGTVTLRNVVVVSEVQLQSVLFHLHRVFNLPSGGAYAPKLRFEGVWLPESIRGATKLVYNGTPIEFWDVADTVTDRPVAFPPNAVKG